ncbi:creatininase family protein [Marinibaculum pumilum]|uniref:Creatininase family protein n=1 Tax=Marinibaculum pumilum TaxID=1766165 RepID=A0ABV7L4V4_9PROT
MEIFWNRLTAPELRLLAEEDAIVLLPVGSTEQHGPHLPTGVDHFLATEVCRRAALTVGTERPAVVAPGLWCGLADHHLAFGGTFTLSLGTYHAVLRDLCRSILGAGFSRLVIVNGHGGNVMGLAAIATELTRELQAPIATTSYFLEAGGGAARIMQDQDDLMHAGEGETAMIMAIAPDLVRGDRLAEAHGPRLDLARMLRPALGRVQGFDAFTTSGVAGDARRATAEKGEALLELYAGALARRLLAGEPWGRPEPGHSEKS